MGAGFAFDIELRRGAGAYICGEETALFNSIEGFRGEPRNKPPFPSVSGLFGKPTVINNVETLLNVLQVLDIGGPAFAAIGTRPVHRHRSCSASPARSPRRASTRCRSAPRCASCSTLAGGVPRATLRAVLLGGAAGGFVLPDQLDVPLTFEGTREIGATLGSGVVLVFDDTVDLPADPAADRRVLPRRVVRAVRAVPGRHRPPGGGARPARPRRAARIAERAGAARRPRAGHAGRVDLRPRADRVQRRRVGHRALALAAARCRRRASRGARGRAPTPVDARPDPPHASP